MSGIDRVGEFVLVDLAEMLPVAVPESVWVEVMTTTVDSPLLDLLVVVTTVGIVVSRYSNGVAAAAVDRGASVVVGVRSSKSA